MMINVRQSTTSSAFNNERANPPRNTLQDTCDSPMACLGWVVASFSTYY